MKILLSLYLMVHLLSVALTNRVTVEITNTIKVFERRAPYSARQKYLPALEEMKRKSREIISNQQQEAVAGAISALRENMGKLLSSNPVESVQGVLDILTPAIALTGPVGLAMSGFLSLLSGFLGMVGGGSAKFDSSFAGIVRKELALARNKELKQKAEGSLHLLGSDSVFLDSFISVSKCPLTRFSRHSLRDMLMLTQHDRFIGELLAAIRSCSHTTDVEIARGCLSLISAYVKIRTQKDLQLTRMILVFQGCAYGSQATISGVKSVIATNKMTDTQFFPFLHFPKAENLAIASIYQPRPEMKFPDIEMYLKKLKVQALPSGDWINPRYGQARVAIYNDINRYKYYLYVGLNWEGVVYVSKSHATNLLDRAKFYFDRRADGYWAIRSVRWPHLYLFVTNTFGAYVRTWNGDPGPQGHFNLLFMDNGHGSHDLVISTEKWPNYILNNYALAGTDYLIALKLTPTLSKSQLQNSLWYLQTV